MTAPTLTFTAPTDPLLERARTTAARWASPLHAPLGQFAAGATPTDPTRLLAEIAVCTDAATDGMFSPAELRDLQALADFVAATYPLPHCPATVPSLLFRCA